MYEFEVSKLWFEQVVFIGLPKYTVGHGTMTATCESPFLFLKKKKKSKWVTINSIVKISNGWIRNLEFNLLTYTKNRLISQSDSTIDWNSLSKNTKNTIYVLSFHSLLLLVSQSNSTIDWNSLSKKTKNIIYVLSFHSLLLSSLLSSFQTYY